MKCVLTESPLLLLPAARCELPLPQHAACPELLLLSGNGGGNKNGKPTAAQHSKEASPGGEGELGSRQYKQAVKSGATGIDGKDGTEKRK